MNLTIKNIDSTLRETFWTDATEEDILWSIHIHNNRPDLIRHWDKNKIKNNIGWLSYHLRRAGFKIDERKPNEPTYVKIINEINIK